MSDPGDSARNFLQRWSRRKRAAENRARNDVDSSAVAKEADRNVAVQGDTDLAALDPANLPPIESITATSDICAFLAPGVPEELARAALRRAWVTDPAIRSFIGIAENQWDFTKPDSIPGFGSLELTPALRRAALSLIGDALGQTGEQQADAEQVKQISEISGQLLPPAKVSALGAERSPTRTDFAISEITSADSIRIVAEDSRQDSENDAFVQKSCGDTDGSSQSIYRKHGGAVPK
jgi:Protein of unknown function (DUF3306)